MHQTEFLTAGVVSLPGFYSIRPRILGGVVTILKPAPSLASLVLDLGAELAWVNFGARRACLRFTGQQVGGVAIFGLADVEFP